jgi:DNA mismatch repair protein PMS2
VLDLAAAVKELVENSLDAGATNIEIRLKEYGAVLIEVADNGSGISPDNYQGLTLKYHTSKISEFSDLQSLSSFGFRGEALSSLCALSNVSVTTRTKEEAIGTRLDYDHSGAITSQQSVARAVGTTVAVAKLFAPLPVRHKEFTRNIRREYGRLLSILQVLLSFLSQGIWP